MAFTAEERQSTTEELGLSDDEKLQRFKLDIITDAEQLDDQRDKANEDMRFIHATAGMWEGFLEDENAKRVKLQLDITSPYINRFIAQWNENRIGVDFKPDERAVTDKDAELLTGIRNADFREFAGQLSQDNAVDEVATSGYGCYMLATEFEDQEDPENDNQRIVYRPIHTAYNAVFWDNASKWIDKRDARRCTRLFEFTRSSFKEMYPDDDAVSAYVPESRRFENFNNSGGSDIIYIATRYEIVRTKVKAWVYSFFREEKTKSYFEEEHELIKDELKENPDVEFIRVREVIRQTVEKTVFSGEKILEETRRIAGKWIPIIPIYAYRGYVDGVEFYKGLVRGLMDPQRLFNMQISQLAENAASNGQETPIFDPSQMVGEISKAWADKNNKAWLPAKALRNPDGSIAAMGPIGYSRPGQLDQSTAALMQIVIDYVQQVTGGAPQDTLDPNASGKAIQALLKRENLNTQDIMQNISNAVRWEGTVYASMASEVYNTRRIVRTLGKDGVETEKQLQQVVFDEETSMVVEANAIGGKKFRAFSDTGPQYESSRDQAIEELKGMLSALVDTPAAQKYTPAIIQTILMLTPGPELDGIKKMVRRDMILQGLIEAETDEEKQFLTQALQKAGEDDPNAQLAKSLAIQAESEGRERDSKAIVNIADAQKKQAETAEIRAKTGREDATSFANILEKVRALPI